jgi:hypothetical protein
MRNPEGPIDLIAAIFERARLDLESGNSHLENARDFLYSDETAEAMALWGIEPDCYRAMLENECNPEAELDRRIQALHRWGLSRTGIALELWGSIGTSYLARIKAVLGPSRDMGR